MRWAKSQTPTSFDTLNRRLRRRMDSQRRRKMPSVHGHSSVELGREGTTLGLGLGAATVGIAQHDEDRFGVFVCGVIFAYLAALVASVAAICAWAWDIEPAGMGAALSTFVVPGIVCFAIASVRSRSLFLGTVTYVLLALPYPLYLLAQGVVGDDWGQVLGPPLMASAIAAYLVLHRWHIVRWRRKSLLSSVVGHSRRTQR